MLFRSRPTEASPCVAPTRLLPLHLPHAGFLQTPPPAAPGLCPAQRRGSRPLPALLHLPGLLLHPLGPRPCTSLPTVTPLAPTWETQIRSQSSQNLWNLLDARQPSRYLLFVSEVASGPHPRGGVARSRPHVTRGWHLQSHPLTSGDPRGPGGRHSGGRPSGRQDPRRGCQTVHLRGRKPGQRPTPGTGGADAAVGSAGSQLGYAAGCPTGGESRSVGAKPTSESGRRTRHWDTHHWRLPSPSLHSPPFMLLRPRPKTRFPAPRPGPAPPHPQEAPQRCSGGRQAPQHGPRSLTPRCQQALLSPHPQPPGPPHQLPAQSRAPRLAL